MQQDIFWLRITIALNVIITITTSSFLIFLFFFLCNFFLLFCYFFYLITYTTWIILFAVAVEVEVGLHLHSHYTSQCNCIHLSIGNCRLSVRDNCTRQFCCTPISYDPTSATLTCLSHTLHHYTVIPFFPSQLTLHVVLILLFHLLPFYYVSSLRFIHSCNLHRSSSRQVPWSWTLNAEDNRKL